ncbi:MAG: hypothetical protein HYX79_09010 [Chloroflexi bacterium]|nr:hypothetical protein [Chloroflexota bacterium]
MPLLDVDSRIRHELLEFQIGDLRKASCAGLNFLSAIGLMVATEFLGGLITGFLGQKGHSEKNFKAGFKYLGKSYEDLLTNKTGVLDIYKNVRCGLVHQYLPSGVSSIYNRATSGSPGVIEKSGQLVIAVDNYVVDLKDAINRLLCDLKTNPKLLKNCEKGLSQIPTLA